MSYTLRVPIRTLGEKPITDLSDADCFTLDGVLISLSAKPPHLILKATGFGTEDAANAFLPRAIAGFWSLAVRWNIAFKADFRPQSITYTDDPEQAAVNLAKTFGRINERGPVHGIVEADSTVIFPSEKNIVTIGLGEARATVSTPAHLAISTFRHGLGLRNATIFSDARFRTAMELYVEHFYETSPKARFLSLMTVLEVLAPTTEKHEVVQKLIRAWKDEISTMLDQLAPGSDERAALESLNRELDFRRETSIRMRLRTFIRNEFQDKSDHVRVRFESDVIAAYDARGELIHTGSLDPKSLTSAHETVSRIVRLLLGKSLDLGNSFD